MKIGVGKDMRDAPQDRNILVLCPEYQGLQAMWAVARWHKDAGFCVDELRQPVMWWDFPTLLEAIPMDDPEK